MNNEANLIVSLFFLIVFGLSLADSSLARDAGGDDRPRADLHSFSNPEQVCVQKIELDLTPDFERREIKGIVVLVIQRQPGCPANAPLVLDTRALTIDEVGIGTRGLLRRRGFSLLRPIRSWDQS